MTFSQNPNNPKEVLVWLCVKTYRDLLKQGIRVKSGVTPPKVFIKYSIARLALKQDPVRRKYIVCVSVPKVWVGTSEKTHILLKTVAPSRIQYVEDAARDRKWEAKVVGVEEVTMSGGMGSFANNARGWGKPEDYKGNLTDFVTNESLQVPLGDSVFSEITRDRVAVFLDAIADRMAAIMRSRLVTNGKEVTYSCKKEKGRVGNHNLRMIANVETYTIAFYLGNQYMLTVGCSIYEAKSRSGAVYPNHVEVLASISVPGTPGYKDVGQWTLSTSEVPSLVDACWKESTKYKRMKVLIIHREEQEKPYSSGTTTFGKLPNNAVFKIPNDSVKTRAYKKYNDTTAIFFQDKPDPTNRFPFKASDIVIPYAAVQMPEKS